MATSSVSVIHFATVAAPTATTLAVPTATVPATTTASTFAAPTATFPATVTTTVAATIATFSPVSISSVTTPVTVPSPTTYPTGVAFSRSVAVDDSNTINIQYTGNWISIANTTQYDNYGNYGTPYQGTLHAITNGTGSIAFIINGTSGEITGTTKVANISSGGIDPQWFCTIDGFKIKPDDPSPQAQNNWPLCQWNDLSPGVHVITLNATSNGQTFFFDRMSYIPSGPSGVPHGNESIIVPWFDPLIEYDESWAGFSGTSMMTSMSGGTCNISFEGTAVEWYATLPSQFVEMRTPSSATYSIDNEAPIFFKTGSLSLDSPSEFNQLQLKTPELAPGTHILTVQFLGDASTAPLFLESLIIHNSTAAETSSSTSTLSISTGIANTSSSRPSEISTKRTPVGTIIGAAVGGSVVLIIIFLTIWYVLYKARQKRRLSEQLLDIDEPLPPALHPFTLEPNDIVKDTPNTTDTVQRLPCDSADYKSRYPTLNRNTMPAPPNLQLHLQLQNASRSESDLSDPFPQPHERKIVHRDSGIRLIDGIKPPVEYPPVYTPQ